MRGYELWCVEVGRWNRAGKCGEERVYVTCMWVGDRRENGQGNQFFARPHPSCR